MSKRTLSHIQFFQLTTFVVKHKETIEQEEMGRQELANFCEQNLDFKISPSSIDTVLKALGKDAPKLKHTRKNRSQYILYCYRITGGSPYDGKIKVVARNRDEADRLAEITVYAWNNNQDHTTYKFEYVAERTIEVPFVAHSDNGEA